MASDATDVEYDPSGFSLNTVQDPRYGEVTFNVPDGKGGEIEMIRLSPGGDIYVKGRLVENDKEVVEGLREFLLGVRNGK